MAVAKEADREAVHRACCDDQCLTAVAGTRFDERRIAHAATAFRALGDEIRLKILTLLSRHDALCVCEIQQAFEVGQPTISHHLRVLREAGLVDVTRHGIWAYYALRRNAIKALIQELVGAI
ncbi:MAG: metalloregulator ArsR/SmtB family transcription factor [Armatimonadota bacterium]|nr:metalloregulator ArsR/SmtB family transcription factor [Armatimonadota bacterium]